MEHYCDQSGSRREGLLRDNSGGVEMALKMKQKMKFYSHTRSGNVGLKDMTNMIPASRLKMSIRFPVKTIMNPSVICRSGTFHLASNEFLNTNFSESDTSSTSDASNASGALCLKLAMVLDSMNLWRANESESRSSTSSRDEFFLFSLYLRLTNHQLEHESAQDPSVKRKFSGLLIFKIKK